MRSALSAGQVARGVGACVTCIAALLIAPATSLGANIQTDAGPDTNPTLGDGQPLTDEARVTGRTGANGGRIRFRLYAPDNPDCLEMPPLFTHVHEEFVDYPASENGFRSTEDGDVEPEPVPQQAGTYKWIAAYIDDPPNAVSGECGDAGESTNVSKATPTISTVAAADGKLGENPVLTDDITVTGRINAQEPDPQTPGTDGWIRFEVYPPLANGNDNDECEGQPEIIDMPYPAAGGRVTSPPATPPTRSGTYRWIAHYLGDANNTPVDGECGDAQEATFIFKATPGLTPHPSASIALGDGPLTDTVDVTAINPASQPNAARVVFELYGRNDTTCAGPIVHTSDKPVVNGTATSSPYEPLLAGTYSWRIRYLGDANNEPRTLACSAANRTVVDRATPAVVVTDTSDGFIFGTPNARLTISARVNGRQLPQGPESLSFTLFGPNDPTCSGTPTPIRPADRPYDGSPAIVTSAPVTPPRAGFYRWRVRYSGDINNKEVETSCASAEEIEIERRPTTISTTPSAAVMLGDNNRLTLRATLNGSFEPDGTMRFAIYGPDDDTCTTERDSSDMQQSPSGAPVTSAPFTPHEPGVYRWIASYLGDENNAPSTTGCPLGGSTLVRQAEPSMRTDATAEATLGTDTITDTATMTGEFEPSAQRSVTFELYGPNNTMCTGASIVPAVAVAFTGSSATAPPFTPQRAGTYRWIARYSGDLKNKATAGKCGDPDESSQVSKATPRVETTASPDAILSAALLTASTKVVGRVSAEADAELTFRLYGPDDDTCSGSPAFTQQHVDYPPDGEPSVTSAAFVPPKAGTYRWRVDYSGDANNAQVDGVCNGPNQNVRVGGVTPTLTTGASPNIVLGAGSLTDSASLGGRAPTTVAASIDFRLYGPDDASCARPPAFTSLGVPYPTVGGVVTSAHFTPTQAGLYRWVASFSGDDNNVPVDGGCNDAGESVTVVRSTPTLLASPSPTITLGTASLTDSVVVNGRQSPVEGGAVDFRAFAPGDTTCSRPPVFSSLGHLYPAAGGSVTSAAFSPTRAGTYRWVASYRGDANNAPVGGTCTAANATTVSSGQGQRVPNRAQTRRVTAKTTPKHDRTKLYTFTTTGRVIPPVYCGPTAVPSIVGSACVLPICPVGSIDPSDCTRPAQKLLCATGKLTVRLIRIAYTVSTRTVGLRPDCTYRTRVSLKSSSPFRRGALTVRVRFEGNPFLLPKQASSQIVRAG